MDSKPSNSTIAFTALGVLFVGLKLTGHIDWSWWWVTLPFWIGIAFFMGVFFLIVIAGALPWLLELIYEQFKKRRQR